MIHGLRSMDFTDPFLSLFGQEACFDNQTFEMLSELYGKNVVKKQFCLNAHVPGGDQNITWSVRPTE